MLAYPCYSETLSTQVRLLLDLFFCLAKTVREKVKLSEVYLSNKSQV